MTLYVEDICVVYARASGEEIRAIDRVSFSVLPGEFVAIIGPSGCGKSTLLHCMGGLLPPTGGFISHDDIEIVHPDPTSAAFVFQEYALLPWKSVADNAAIGLRFARVPKAKRRTAALKQLDFVGLKDFASSYPSELSGGMQQRVAVARALAMDPEILLLDEPFGSLDEQSRRDLGVEMSRILTEAGKTLVLVTHSLDEAIFWADRLIVMSERPGSILKEIRIDSPRPRDISFMTNQEFNNIRTSLLDALSLSGGAHADAHQA